MTNKVIGFSENDNYLHRYKIKKIIFYFLK